MNKAKHVLTNRNIESLESLIKKKSWGESARSGFHLTFYCNVLKFFKVFLYLLSQNLC